MRRTACRALLVLALIVSGCRLGDVDDGGSTLTIEIDTPESVDWRRTVAGIEVAGSGTDPDATELALLGAALEEMPPELLRAAEVRTIYRIPSDVAAEESEALAFSRGPDVYLTDGTFRRAGTRFEMAEVLAHEFAHTWQFAALTPSDLDRIDPLDSGTILETIEFVREFAASVGWRDVGSGDRPTWQLSNDGGVTPYGTSSPAEDMADTVSHVVMGRAGELSRDRVGWVESALGTSGRELAEGKPYVPAGAVEIAPDTPLFDEERAARLSPGRTEPRSWALAASSPQAASLAREVQDELGRRGYGGSLRRTDDDRIARFTGEFVRGDGLQLLVELWDFRDAPGYSNPPDQPVLTYVVMY